MQLTVKDVANLLKVNEKTIYRWLKKGDMPAYCVGNQYRFNRAELLEWATSRQIGVSADIFVEPENSQVSINSLADALNAGGIHYRVEGEDKQSVLKNVVKLMTLPPEVDKEFLLQVILAREAMASTAVGDGIAIPHVRNPIVLHITEPVVSLCFLEKPVDFNSLDGKPVNCLFTLVSPTVKMHLYLLSRIAYMLRDDSFKNVIEKQGAREKILSEIIRVESGLQQDQSRLADGEVS
ncbi:MAG: PTS sugar transporter subunit IIA [Sedimentisphaerales bacterium]|nr:PTS sugar transporter subunit IIA [Sedimentisphaerales bacterium]